MYVEATRYILLPLVLKLHMLTYYEAHNFITYKNNGSKHKMLLTKNHVSRFGEKVLKQDY